MSNTSDGARDLVSEAHELVCKTFRDELEAGDVSDARMKVIVQFLKDNEITVDPVRNPTARFQPRKLPHTEAAADAV